MYHKQTHHTHTHKSTILYSVHPSLQVSLYVHHAALSRLVESPRNIATVVTDGGWRVLSFFPSGRFIPNTVFGLRGYFRQGQFTNLLFAWHFFYRSCFDHQNGGMRLVAVVPEGSGLNSSARMLQINQHKYSKIINTFTYILTYFASNINIPLRPAHTHTVLDEEWMSRSKDSRSSRIGRIQEGT